MVQKNNTLISLFITKIKKVTILNLAKNLQNQLVVLVISVSVIDGDEKFVREPYIYFLIWVNQDKIWALFNNKNKVNAMRPNYT